MPNYSKRSKNNLNECHIDLITIFNEVIKYIDITILDGHRGKIEQNKVYNEGNSQVQYPNSKHNKMPAMATDFVSYPIKWDDREQHYFTAGMVMGIAEVLYHQDIITHRVKFGGDWNQNDIVSDETFKDLFHIELI